MYTQNTYIVYFVPPFFPFSEIAQRKMNFQLATRVEITTIGSGRVFPYSFFGCYFRFLYRQINDCVTHTPSTLTDFRSHLTDPMVKGENTKLFVKWHDSMRCLSSTGYKRQCEICFNVPIKGKTFFILFSCALSFWKKNKNKNLTASQRSRWRFVILSLPSSLSCRVYDSALFWSWGSDRGPDTIYLMLVTHTHSGTVCPARLLYYFNVYRLVHRALYLSLVSSKNIWEFISLLFFGRGEFIASSPILIRHYVSSCKKLSDQCRAFFINSFSSFLSSSGSIGPRRNVADWVAP